MAGWRVLFIAVVAFGLSGARDTWGHSDDVARAFRTLTLERDGRVQDAVMRSLRSLRDPALGPLFSRLAQAESPTARAHAIVALSEAHVGKTEERLPRRLDLLLVRTQEPPVQAAVLRLALDAGLIDDRQLADLLRWPDLPEAVALAVLARLPAADPAVDDVLLARFASGTHDARAITALAIMDQRHGTHRLREAGTRVEAMLAANRHEGLMSALTVIVENRLQASVPVLREWAARFRADRLIQAELAMALLAIDPQPDTAGAEWVAAYAAARDDGDAARLQLGALRACGARRTGLPAAVAEALAGDGRASGALVARIVRAVGLDGAGARHDPEAAVAAVESALMARCAPVVHWAEEIGIARPDEAASAAILGRGAPGEARRVRVLAGLLRAMQGVSDAAALARAGRAAVALAAHGPAGAAELARTISAALPRGDERLTRVLLEAALLGGPGACERAAETCADPALEASGLDTHTLGLVELIRARLRATHTPAQVDQLARLAQGAGGLAPAARVQAAWLVLRATGRDQAAVALTIAGVEP